MSDYDKDDDEDSFTSIEIPIKKEEKEHNTKETVMADEPKGSCEVGVGTTISPVKLQLVEFKNLIEMNRLRLKFIQPEFS